VAEEKEAVRMAPRAGAAEQTAELARSERAALERESEWVARFLREQGMQTNEVQRCYGLLPAFLLAAAETGINPFW